MEDLMIHSSHLSAMLESKCQFIWLSLDRAVLIVDLSNSQQYITRGSFTCRLVWFGSTQHRFLLCLLMKAYAQRTWKRGRISLRRPSPTGRVQRQSRRGQGRVAPCNTPRRLPPLRSSSPRPRPLRRTRQRSRARRWLGLGARFGSTPAGLQRRIPAEEATCRRWRMGGQGREVTSDVADLTKW